MLKDIADSVFEENDDFYIKTPAGKKIYPGSTVFIIKTRLFPSLASYCTPKSLKKYWGNSWISRDFRDSLVSIPSPHALEVVSNQVPPRKRNVVDPNENRT